ncbi:YdcF family protein [Tistrella mobilis]|uniref:YdcF family protein n=1 Tax=Tistrella mobilis TaxID=171437 RepID=UPI003556E214
MFFSVSKLVGHLVLPVTLLLLSLALAPFLRWAGLKRIARFLGTAGGVAMAVILFTPLDYWLLAPLENRFPRVERETVATGNFAGIVVLGGPEDGRLTRAHHQPSVGAAAERFIEAAILARLRPDLPVVFTGGSGVYSDPDAKGGPVAEALLRDLGVAPDRLMIESESRNTFQNAIFAKEMVGDVSGRPWLLITSAAHMPRSYGIFISQGWNVTAYPVDYNTFTPVWGWNDYRFTDRLNLVHLATREWVGLIVYRLTGRLGSMFPSPVGGASPE